VTPGCLPGVQAAAIVCVLTFVMALFLPLLAFRLGGLSLPMLTPGEGNPRDCGCPSSMTPHSHHP
jgi:hypothetical protein